MRLCHEPQAERLRRGGHLQLFDAFEDCLLLVDAQRLVLLLKLQLPDFGVNLVVVCHPQVPVGGAEVVLDLLLGIQQGLVLVVPLLLLRLPLLLPTKNLSVTGRIASQQSERVSLRLGGPTMANGMGKRGGGALVQVWTLLRGTYRVRRAVALSWAAAFFSAW